jgi:HK97 family phage portal protein
MKVTDIFTIFRKKEKRAIYEAPVDSVGLPYSSTLASPLSLQTSMQLSAVYRCVEVISDSMASQPWEILEYDSKQGWIPNPFHNSFYLLNSEPAPYISRYTFMKTLMAKVLLEGNGYAIIRRDNRGDPIRLDLVGGLVTMFKRANGSIYYLVDHPNYEPIKTEYVEGYDMIHILNFSYNGYLGVSTLTHAVNSMGLASVAEATAKGFYSSGANMSGILQTAGKVTKEKATTIKASWAEAFSQTTGTPGGIAVIESGLEFTPVTVAPKDAQMLEARQFSVLEICRFFGCPPPKVFDQAGLTYSNVEAYQLGFITDTISPLDAKVENEFNRKLFRPSMRARTQLNLNINELLRANLDAKANYVSKMFQCGGYNVNEVRKECRNPLSSDPNADKPMIQVNMIPVDKIGQKQPKIDNKVKTTVEE